MRICAVIAFALILNTPTTLAEKLQDGEPLSFKYRKGPYLLYDCHKRHYVCTEKAEFKQCVDYRRVNRKYRDIKYDCVSFKKFDESSACQVEQVKLAQGAFSQNTLCAISK